MFKYLEAKDKVSTVNTITENIILDYTGSNNVFGGIPSGNVEKFNNSNFYHISCSSGYSSWYNEVYSGDYMSSQSVQLFDISVGRTGEAYSDGFDSYKRFMYSQFLKQLGYVQEGYTNFRDIFKFDNSKVYAPSFNNVLFIAFKKNIIKDGFMKNGITLYFKSHNNVITSSNVIHINDYVGSDFYVKNSFNMHFNILHINDFTVDPLTSSLGNGGSIVGLVNYELGIMVFDLNRLGQAGLANFNMSNYLSCSNANLNDILSASFDIVINYMCISSSNDTFGKFTYYNFYDKINLISNTFFCRLDANEFNYSTNPTYIDNNNLIRTVSGSIDTLATPYTYITAIGLYDVNDNLLAISKLSRPVKKGFENSLTFRIRLDY